MLWAQGPGEKTQVPKLLSLAGMELALLVVPLAGVPPGEPAVSQAEPAAASVALPAAASVPQDLGALLSHGDSLQAVGQIDSALVILEAVRAQSRLVHDNHALVRASLELASIVRGRNQSAKAEEILTDAEPYAAATRDTSLWCETLIRCAQAMDAQGRPPRAIPRYERAIELAEAAGASTYVGLGNTYLARRELGAGNVDRATARLERAISIFRELKQRGDEFRAVNLLGICRQRAGELDEARQCWTEALQYAREAQDPSLEGNCLNNLGALEVSQGYPDRAAAYWERAYQIQRAEGDLRAAIVPASNAAIAFKELGRYAEAESLLAEQLEIARRFGFKDREASARLHLGEIARDRLRSSEAAAHYRAALALLRGTDLPALEADALKGLARALDDADSLEAAIPLMQAALPELRPHLGREQSLVMDGELAQLLIHAGRHAEALALTGGIVPEVKKHGLPKLGLHVLRLEAAAYRGLGRPDSALACLWRAADAWEAMRSLPVDPQWREQRGELGSAVHGALADLLLEHPPDLSAGERRARTFEFMQRFKTRTLMERMHASGADPNVAPVRLCDIQGQVLQEGELLLDFSFAPEQTLLFAITRDSCRVVRLVGSEPGLRRQVELCLDLVSSPPPSGGYSSAELDLAERTCAALADTLLGEVRDLVLSAQRIIYAPDDVLHRLPLRPLLDALRADRVLVLRVPSAAVLTAVLTATSAMEHPEDSWLAYAAVHAGSRDDLSGARREVRALGERYRHVRVWVEDQSADRTLQAEDLRGYQIVHLAGHHAIDDQRPWRSGILVRAGLFPEAEAPDSFLSAERIAASTLEARLAVLSGCESAGGRIISGEGVLGLTTAFLGAGARCVVSTLWPVDDARTARFMEMFYRFLEQGLPVASALHEAQSRTRADPETRHPFYWAGFVVTGDGDVTVILEPRTKAMRLILVMAVVLAVLAVGLVRARGCRINKSTAGFP